MKTAYLVRVSESEVYKAMPSGLSILCMQLYGQGRKRMGPTDIITGATGDDFMYNMVSIVFQTRSCRIPRILNPLHKRTKTQNFFKKC